MSVGWGETIASSGGYVDTGTLNAVRHPLVAQLRRPRGRKQTRLDLRSPEVSGQNQGE